MTREDAIYYLNNLRAFSEEDDEPAIDMAIEALKQEPVKHGKWIMGELYVKCSECGYPVGHVSDNYCPNCGAKMDGDKHEID